MSRCGIPGGDVTPGSDTELQLPFPGNLMARKGRRVRNVVPRNLVSWGGLTRNSPPACQMLVCGAGCHPQLVCLSTAFACKYPKMSLHESKR